MYVRPILLACGALWLCFAGVAGAADVDIRPLDGAPPRIDAVVDAVWSNATIQYITKVISGSNPSSPSDSSGSWRMLWDSKYLYVLVDVNDDSLRNDSSQSNSWQDDTAEVYIDGNNSKGASTDQDDYQYCIRWNTVVETPREFFHQPTSLQGVEYAVTNTASGYRFEIKLPWATLIGKSPRGGQLIGVDVFINDDDDGGDSREAQLSWHAASGDGWSIPSMWGTAYLIPSKKAGAPTPEDGASFGDTWATLGWTPGETAATHEVYFGESYDAVAAGTGGTYRGSLPLATTWFIVGFPGHPYPNGLIPGNTYYWRVDEVETNGTKHKGEVWSFTLLSPSATNPQPANGAKFIDINPTLSWSAGFKAMVHFVYIGTDYNTVNNAVGGIPYGPTTYQAGPLLNNTVYYWRIDELDGAAMHKGPVWSFTTTRAGGGLRGEYYNSLDFSNLVLSRTDPQVRFDWGIGSPDAAVNVDNFCVRWIGEVETAFSETYKFFTRTDEGARLWVDGQMLVNRWVDQSTTEHYGSIALEAGIHSLQMDYYERSSGAVAELRWESPSTPKQLIPQGAFSLPVRASNPSPASGSSDAVHSPILTWRAGERAASHNVYFGTIAAEVANATTTSGEYKGNKPRGSESYVPGKLGWNMTYYWRVDEVNTLNPEGPWKGSLWSFTTADFIGIDDMEDYNNFPPDRIFETWIDGYGNSSVNGSIVGHPDPDFAAGENFVETAIIHDGKQSMPYYYNCNFKYSEAVMTLKNPKRDWTQDGVKSLSLWFRGYPATQGSLTEAPAGTFKMTGAGSDIWIVGGREADEFHYAWKMLNGPGTITAKVSAITGTSLNDWAKAGLMIRESLDPNSAHAFMALTNTQGIAFQYRPTAAGTSVNHHQKSGESNRPMWLRLDRAFDGTFTASHANDVAGAPDKWTAMNTANVQMQANVYIGLALTSHQAYVPGQATFSNITLAGTITGTQWTNQDIGIRSNVAERMFVAVKGTTGSQVIVYHPDPQAATLNTWSEWHIPLTAFAGTSLNNVDTISIGFGTKGNTSPGGSGLVYFDDIRLYKARCMPTIVKPAADLNSNCVVDMPDLKLMANDWLKTGAALASDLDQSQKVDFKDYNALAETWLEEKLWP